MNEQEFKVFLEDIIQDSRNTMDELLEVFKKRATDRAAILFEKSENIDGDILEQMCTEELAFANGYVKGAAKNNAVHKNQ